jgi:hypothetical protein
MNGHRIVRVITLTSVAALLMLLSACQFKPKPIDYGASFSQGKYTAAEVQQAIKEALNENHWILLQEKPNYLRASKQVRNQKAVIHIPYGDQGYDIEYAAGDNMKYNTDKQTIAKLYLHWESALIQSIHRYLATIHASSSSPQA